MVEINERPDNVKFLQALEVAEKSLLILHFKKSYFEKRGYAYFVGFEREDCRVRFSYGPPEYEIDIVIFTLKSKFEFKDLLQIPAIVTWVKDNRYIPTNRKDLEREMLWLIELLKFSLPLIK